MLSRFSASTAPEREFRRTQWNLPTIGSAATLPTPSSATAAAGIATTLPKPASSGLRRSDGEVTYDSLTNDHDYVYQDGLSLAASKSSDAVYHRASAGEGKAGQQ